MFSETTGRQYILAEYLMNTLTCAITEERWGSGGIIALFSGEEKGAQQTQVS